MVGHFTDTHNRLTSRKNKVLALGDIEKSHHKANSSKPLEQPEPKHVYVTQSVI